jgi:hypothetical protein
VFNNNFKKKEKAQKFYEILALVNNNFFNIQQEGT